ncbi:MAG: sulfatase [Rubripirellula sp.]
MNRFVQRAVYAALILCGVAQATWAESRPNVVFIISDDQGWGDYSFLEHPTIKTPNLDRLAKQSLTFTRGYTPVPLCRPSLSTIITGCYPHVHGVTGNDPTIPGGVTAGFARKDPQYARYFQSTIDRFSKRPNLVRNLTADGYHSLQTGKWWEGDPTKAAGFSDAMTHGTDKGDRHGGMGLQIGRNGLKPITDFLDDSANRPFLLWYAPMLPHTPHNPPAELLAKSSKLTDSEPVARYWANVEWFDRTCGELLNDLDQRGLRDNTIIVYVCDNGWIQNPATANRDAERSKRTPYEGGVRTPIMISWPGHITPRMDTEHLASTIDLWPTIAKLLGTKHPDDLSGINLTNEATVANRSTVFGEQYNHDIASVDEPTRSLEHRWVIDGYWKLIAPDPRNLPDAKAELYDLEHDPNEKQDLAAKNPERVADLSKQLDQWWKPSND